VLSCGFYVAMALEFPVRAHRRFDPDGLEMDACAIPRPAALDRED
jgi:hypothetical protein